jgi:hypothetical protein
MTGAAPAVAPAAPAAGNATLLSAQPDPAPDPTPKIPPAEQPPAEQPAEPETEPAEEPKEEPKEDEGAPYGAFTLPEGTAVDQAALDAALPAFKDAKLTKAQAQAVVETYAKLQASQAEAQAAQVKEWAKAVTTDKEIGGAKWAENRALIAQARDQFASPELVSLMEQTGLGSHPEVIKMFVRIGKAIADDGHVTGGGSPTQPVDFATDYYAKMPKLERTR